MQTEFTPGPWSTYIQTYPHEVLICTLRPAAAYDSPVAEQIAWTAINPYVAGSDSHEAYKAKSLANAKLLSAAPELLAALKVLVDAMPIAGGMVRFDGDELSAARAAIAKALGK